MTIEVGSLPCTCQCNNVQSPVPSTLYDFLSKSVKECIPQNIQVRCDCKRGMQNGAYMSSL